jgi:hypothetical protein
MTVPATAFAARGGRGSQLALAAFVAVVVVLRLVGLHDYPPPATDEGGWVLETVDWLHTGRMTEAFAEVPAFVLQLAPWLRSSEPPLFRARLISSVYGLLGLLLFWRIAARLLSDRRPAMAATVLLATSYAAVLTGRRALVEPMQTTWMLAVVLCSLRTSISGLAGLGATVAIAITTKASALAVLPVALLAPLLAPRSPGLPAGRVARRVAWHGAALLTGLGVATLAFWLVSRSNPEAFQHYWHRTLSSVRDDAAPLGQAGRFGLDIGLLASLPFELLRDEPVLFPLALAGCALAIRDAALRLPAVWLGCTILFLAAQVWRLQNHLAIAHAPMALLAGAFLWRVADGRGVAPSPRWAPILFGLAILASAARFGLGVSRNRDEAAEAVQWIRGNIPDTARVVGAPYILMRTKVDVESFATAGDSSLAPTSAALRASGVDWVVVDEREWRSLLRSAGRTQDAEREIARCCRQRWSSPAVDIYEVVPAETTATPPAAETQDTR